MACKFCTVPEIDVEKAITRTETIRRGWCYCQCHALGVNGDILMENSTKALLAIFATTYPGIASASKEAGLVDFWIALIGAVFVLLWSVFACVIYLLTRKIASKRNRRLLRSILPVLLSGTVLVIIYLVML